MKKHILFMLTLCACALLSGSASGIENNDSMDNSMQAAATIEMQDPDLGPSVAKNIAAYGPGRGVSRVPAVIRIDVYYASNACNVYVAYWAGTTTGAMAVRVNPNCKASNVVPYNYQYYIVYDDMMYGFNL